MSCHVNFQDVEDKPMWYYDLLRKSHEYAEAMCPGQKLGRMAGDESPLTEIEKVQIAFMTAWQIRNNELCPV